MIDGGEKIWNRNYILILISNFLICITYYAIVSSLPIYLVNELHASKSQVGLIMAAYLLASVLVRPFSGYALDKFGRRTIFLIALLFYTLLFAGYILALSIFILVILRFLQGLTWGVATISSTTILVDITPVQKRGEGIGYFGVSTTLAMSVGPVLGLFINQHLGSTAMFTTIFITSILSFTAAALVHFPRRLLVHRMLAFEARNIFSKKSILPSINVLIIMSTYGGLLSFITLFGQEIGVKNSSLFFLIFSIGIITSRFMVGKYFDRNGPKNLLTICLILLIIGFPLLVLLKNEAGFYISAIIIGFGIGVVFPTFQAIINNLADSTNRGAANSTLYTGLDIGMGMGMVFAGYIAQHISVSAIFIYSAAVALIGLIFFRKCVVEYYEKNRVMRGF